MKKIIILSFLCFSLLALPSLVSAAVYVPADTTTPISPTSSTPIVPGQIEGGTQSSNPLNNSVNDSASTGAAPTSMTSATASCNVIAFKTLLDIAIWAKCIIGAVIIPGIFSLAFVVFLWGVFKFIRSSDLKDKQDSKQFIYMGLIGLFIMVSVWGIIKIATTTFGLDSTVPMLQTSDPLNIKNASKK